MHSVRTAEVGGHGPGSQGYARANMRNVRVTTVTVQQTEIWFTDRGGASTGSRSALGRMAREPAEGLGAETLRSLGRMVPLLALAGASALARRAWRASLPAPRRVLPDQGQPVPRTSRRALPGLTTSLGRSG